MIALSDSHGCHWALDVPLGHILVHAGDMTHHGTLAELRDFAGFLAALPHRHKVVIAGNHDLCLQHTPAAARKILADFIYLQDANAVVDGIKFYGSPWQPPYLDMAFNLPRGKALRQKWRCIPDDTEVLVTHCPPAGCLDQTAAGDSAGCADLQKRIAAVHPALHCFGHIHEGAGHRVIDGTIFVNASICDQRYQPINKPVVLTRDNHRWRLRTQTSDLRKDGGTDA